MEPETATAAKRSVNGISAVGIIYLDSDPSKIFSDMKDGTYPRKAFRMKLLCLGGNWIGDAAKADPSPIHTFCREVHEELSFSKPISSTLELAKLFADHVAENYVVEGKDVPITEDDRFDLATVKAEIRGRAEPFGDFYQFVPRVIFDRADSNNKAGDYQGLCSVYTAAISLQTWEKLCRIQEKFGNLSNESITVVTSLDEIVRTGWQTAWGHDRILKEFFLSKGLKTAQNFPLIPDIQVERLGMPLASYNEYLAAYDVAKHPFAG